MSRRSKKRRKEEQAQKEELLADDAFVQQGSTWVTVLEKNIVPVLVVIGAAIVSVVVVDAVRNQGAATASAQTAKLIDGVKAYERAIRFAIATSTQTEAKHTQFEEARSMLSPVLAESTSPPIRGLGLLYDADLSRRLGQYDEAVASYDAYLNIAPGEDPFRYFAHEGKGYALEADGKLDEALAAYRELATSTEFSDFGQKHVARILSQQGDVAGAKEALHRILDRNPPSIFRDFAEKSLGELK